MLEVSKILVLEKCIKMFKNCPTFNALLVVTPHIFLISDMQQTGVKSSKPVTPQISKPSVVDVESSGLKADSGTRVSVGQMGPVSRSSVGLGPRQKVAWQDNSTQQAVEQTQVRRISYYMMCPHIKHK